MLLPKCVLVLTETWPESVNQLFKCLRPELVKRGEWVTSREGHSRGVTESTKLHWRVQTFVYLLAWFCCVLCVQFQIKRHVYPPQRVTVSHVARRSLHSFQILPHGADSIFVTRWSLRWSWDRRRLVNVFTRAILSHTFTPYFLRWPFMLYFHVRCVG
jgi:hypothetical protein